MAEPEGFDETDCVGKSYQNKYVKRCMSIVGIVIVLLGAMLLYHITGLGKNDIQKRSHCF